MLILDRPKPSGTIGSFEGRIVWAISTPQVFAQGSTTLEFPSEAVTAALMAPAKPWSVALDGSGQAHLARVGIRIGAVPVYKHVRLQIGHSTVLLRPDSVMLPVSWTVSGGPPIFPGMEGTLQVEPAGPGRSRLILNARYDPPMGAIGRLMDRLVMHRLAQLTLTDFVERLTQLLEGELRTG